MARIRTIKPTFFTSRSVACLPVPVRVTFVGLWTYADDEGRGVDDARLVKAAVWPLDDKLTAKVIAGHLAELDKHGFICRYTHDGQQYLHVCGFGDHQRINRPQPSRIPPPHHEVKAHPPFTEPSLNDHGTLREPSRETLQGREGKGKERKGREGKGSSSSSTSESRDEPRTASEEEEDEATQEARRRLLCTTSDVTDPSAWVQATAKRLRDEGWAPATPAVPVEPPQCDVCKDLPLAEPCPDCTRRTA